MFLFIKKSTIQKKMLSFPNAKINLGLHIIRKRADNFHDLQTVFYPILWRDVLEILPQENETENLIFHLSGIDIVGKKSDNLCVKAYNLLKKDFPQIPNIIMHLHKNIPTGAGLGGGSTDATAVLCLLNDMFALNLDKEKLIYYASILGSDCAFFVKNTPQIGESRGEILTETNTLGIDLGFLKNKIFVLIKPNIHISTKEAFAHITPNDTRPHIKELIKTPFSDWHLALENDFEKSLFPTFPILKNIKEKLYDLGATYASLSGSGATVFGIFEEKSDNLKDAFLENKDFQIFQSI